MVIVHNGEMQGAISNEGIEVMIKYDIFNREDLYWKISVNGAEKLESFREIV